MNWGGARGCARRDVASNSRRARPGHDWAEEGGEVGEVRPTGCGVSEVAIEREAVPRNRLPAVTGHQSQRRLRQGDDLGRTFDEAPDEGLRTGGHARCAGSVAVRRASGETLSAAVPSLTRFRVGLSDWAKSAPDWPASGEGNEGSRARHWPWATRAARDQQQVGSQGDIRWRGGGAGDR